MPTEEPDEAVQVRDDERRDDGQLVHLGSGNAAEHPERDGAQFGGVAQELTTKLVTKRTT